MQKFTQGSKVRLVNNPSKIGTIRDENPMVRNERVLWKVQFGNGKVEIIPEEHLELYDSIEALTLPEMIQKQRFSSVGDVQQILSETKINGNLSDIIYSMDLTNTDFYAYQFKPVCKIINSPSNAILIADEVGLGKTIEAGLIWTELKQRYDYKRLLIICPKILSDKWQMELRQKMGVKAEILKPSDMVKRIKTEDEYAFICSIQGVSSDEIEEELEKYVYEDQLIDLLIVDEAHKIRNDKTKGNHSVTQLRALANHVVFLSATPIQNKTDDLYSLIKILDPDNFPYKDYFDYMLDNIKGLVFLKTKLLQTRLPINKIIEALQILKNNDGSGILSHSKQLAALIKRLESRKNTELSTEEYQKIAYELDEINSLGYIYNRTRKQDVQENCVVREAIPEKILMTDVEQDLYNLVTKAVYEYVQQKSTVINPGFAKFLLSTPQRMLTSSLYATLKNWRKRNDMANEDEDDYNNNEIPSDFMQAIFDAVEEFHDDMELYDNDTKYERLLSMLKKVGSEYPDDKIVLFSTFVPTLEYLSDRLNKDGIINITLTGKSKDKTEVFNKFKTDPNIKILLASEVGSEGVDLQFCRFLINYDLPWNPMRIEQRIGRVDRIGQKADKILIWNMFHNSTIDDRIYEKLYEKFHICTEVLGDFGEVLGREFEQLRMDLLFLSPEQYDARIKQTEQAIVNKQIQNKQLEQDASELVAYGDYILDKIQGQRHKITAEDLSKYVVVSLQKLYGTKYSKTDNENEYVVTTNNKFQMDFESFCMDNGYSQSSLLLHDTNVVCAFYTKIGTSIANKEVINPTHPLIRFLRHKLAAEADTVYPVAVLISEGSNLPKGEYIIGASLIRAKGISDYAKIIYTAYNTETKKFTTEDLAEHLLYNALSNGNDWTSRQGLDYDALARDADIVMDKNLSIYEDEIEKIQNKNADRAEIQRKAINKHLEQETKRATEMIAKLEAEGKLKGAELNKAKFNKFKMQMEAKLFKIDEKTKLQHEKEDICVVVLKEA